MAFFLLLLELSGLSWNMTYTAQEWHCEEGQITLVMHDQLIPIELFDIALSEEGKVQACAILNEAKTVTFEIDDHVAQDNPLPVWLFSDGQLVQRLLIEQGAAEITIRNPDFTYASQLEAAQSKPVRAQPTSSGIREYSRRRGQLGLAFLCFSISGVLILKVMLRVSARRRA